MLEGRSYQKTEFSLQKISYQIGLLFILFSMKNNNGNADARRLAILEEKVQKMSLKYRELKNCQFPIVKVLTIEELRKLAVQISQMMHEFEHPSNCKRRRQIQDVLKKCDEIEKALEAESNKDIGHGGRNKDNRQVLKEINDAELSKKVLHSVMFHEIRTSELKINPKEYDDIYNRLVKNQEVMREMETMVKEQGHDLDKIDEYLVSVYDNTKLANQELTEANQLQKKTRRLKFKMAISGFFAALGYKILGLPGLIGGLFTGHKITK